jgi:hypothetical protein
LPFTSRFIRAMGAYLPLWRSLVDKEGAFAACLAEDCLAEDLDRSKH